MKHKCLGRTNVYVVVNGFCNHMSQMKSYDYKTCKLKVDLLMKGITFARAIDILYLESSQSTLQSTCRRLVEITNREKVFKFFFS